MILYRNESSILTKVVVQADNSTSTYYANEDEEIILDEVDLLYLIKMSHSMGKYGKSLQILEAREI